MNEFITQTLKELRDRIKPKYRPDTLLRTDECHYGDGKDLCHYHESPYELDEKKVEAFLESKLREFQKEIVASAPESVYESETYLALQNRIQQWKETLITNKDEET